MYASLCAGLNGRKAALSSENVPRLQRSVFISSPLRPTRVGLIYLLVSAVSGLWFSAQVFWLVSSSFPCVSMGMCSLDGINSQCLRQPGFRSRITFVVHTYVLCTLCLYDAKCDHIVAFWRTVTSLCPLTGGFYSCERVDFGIVPRFRPVGISLPLILILCFTKSLI